VLAAKFASYNDGCNDRRILAEKKIVVITDVPRVSTHPLKLHIDNQLPFVFYKGTVGIDPDWDVSFSSHLRVTKVRILQGIVARDPKTTLFALDETTAKVVHPSRIVLFPGYQDSFSVSRTDTYRCYADTDEDGNFDLFRHCLHDSPYTNSNAVHQGLLANPTHLQNAPTDILTWFVEFNPQEGAVVPTLDPNEELAIEFTIEPA
jgi:hypothetical protein